jgi:hypothetical protein
MFYFSKKRPVLKVIPPGNNNSLHPTSYKAPQHGVFFVTLYYLGFAASPAI